MIDFTFIGCGGVGFCLLELIAKEKLYKSCKFTIIEPRDVPDLDKVMKGYRYIQVKESVSKENYQKLLSHLNENSFLVNVSVGVDSIMLIKLCVQKKAHYIDTSLEVYEDFIRIPPEDVSDYAQIMRNNLFHQNYLAMKAQGRDKITRHISSGFNPGFISHFAKKALKEYARSKGMTFTEKNWKGDYAELAHKLGLREIQVVEYDSQKTIPKSSPEMFINTWSAIGFQEEAGDLAMLSLSNEDAKRLREMGYKLIQPTEYPSTIYFVNARGMNIERPSYALDYEGKPFSYKGLLIPHAETISLSEFFRYKNDAPTIMYVYSSCAEAQRGLNYFAENNYNNLPHDKVVRRKEITEGWDSIGALLHFENGDKFGGWSVCSVEDSKKHNLLSGPTTLQVASYMLPCIMWTLKHRKSGMNNPETIPHKEIFKFSEKYLGKIYFRKL